MSKKLRRLTELSLLTAAALIIFAVELQFPDISPVAGVKLGLSNIITVFGVYRYRAEEIGLVLLARILLGSIFSSNPSAILYSLAGGVFCLLGMLLLKRVIPENHLWLCSVLGAVFHNVGQILAAYLIMGMSAVFMYLPFLLVSGCIAGAITGLCAQILVKRLRRKGAGES